jgi:hypothetical protein
LPFTLAAQVWSLAVEEDSPLFCNAALKRALLLLYRAPH